MDKYGLSGDFLNGVGLLGFSPGVKNPPKRVIDAPSKSNVRRELFRWLRPRQLRTDRSRRKEAFCQPDARLIYHAGENKRYCYGGRKSNGKR